jgi:hypothetical protein
MSIYASVVALWFISIALFLTGALIHSWFRTSLITRSGSLALKPMQMMRR